MRIALLLLLLAENWGGFVPPQPQPIESPCTETQDA